MSDVVRYRIEVDTATGKAQLKGMEDSFERTGRVGKRSLDDTGSALDRLKAKMGPVISLAATLAATIGITFGAYQLKAFAQEVIAVGSSFEQTMATVGGVSRATADEFDSMSAAARQMGETTEWSASQSGQALQYLSMAGFDASKSVAALPGVLDLATAGNIDLGRAADVASNALTAMRLPVEQLSRVNDVFIRTITTSNTNMEMMAESFKYSAPVAAGYGMEIETLAAMIGMLGNAGIQGSMAGTQLAAAFSDTQKVFEKYGASATNADGSTKSLIDAIALLSARGASAGDVMEIFGERSGRAILALLGQGVPALQAYIEKIKDSEGATQSLAATMRDTFGNEVKTLNSVLESLKIDIFDNYKEKLRGAIKDTSGWIGEHKREIIALGDSLIHLGKIVGVGGAVYAGYVTLPAVIRATSAAIHALQFDIAATSLALQAGTPLWTVLNTSLNGTTLSATAATGALGRLNIAAGTLFAAFAGWEIGSWLSENFETARLAGIAFVDATYAGFYHLEYGAKVAWEGIKYSWDVIIDKMKAAFATFLEGVAAGLDYVPFAGGAAEWLRSYAGELKTGEANAAGFKDNLADLKVQYDANMQAHRATIDALVSEAMGYDQARKSTSDFKKETDKLPAAAENLSSVSEETKKAADALDKLAEKGAVAGDNLDDLNSSSRLEAMKEHERLAAEIGLRYDELRAITEQLAIAGEITWDEANSRLDAFDKRQAEALQELKKKHDKAASDVTRVWEHAYERLQDITGDWLRGQEISFGTFKDMIWDVAAEWVNAMMWASDNGKLQPSGGFSPNAYSGDSMAGLSSFFYGLGYDRAGDASYGMGNFFSSIPDSTNGSFGYSWSGIGAGILAGTSTYRQTDNPYAGIGSLAGGILGSYFGPIGSMVGSELGKRAGENMGDGLPWHLDTGTLVMGSFDPLGAMVGLFNGWFGGDKENEFTLTELRGRLDSSFNSKAGGFEPTGQRHPAGGNSWYATISDAYVQGIEDVQTAFNAQANQLAVQMPEAARDAFLKGLENADLGVANLDVGRWGVSSANNVVSTIVTKYGDKLSGAINDAFLSVMPQISDSLIYNNPSFGLLSGDVRKQMRDYLGSGDFAKVQQALQYFSQVDTALSNVNEALDVRNMNDLERELHGIDQQFGALSDQLTAAGVDLAAYTRLEREHQEVIGEAIAKARQPVQDILDQKRMSDFALGMREIQEMVDEQYKKLEAAKDKISAGDYSSWLSDINQAAEYQAQDLIDRYITPVTSAWQDWLTGMQTSDLAPVQSAEGIEIQYRDLLAEAQGGSLDAITALQQFVEQDYLPFKQAFGGNYQEDWDRLFGVNGELSNITVDIGEITAGIDSDAIGEAVGRAMLPLLQLLQEMIAQDTTVQLKIGEQDLAEVIVNLYKTYGLEPPPTTGGW